MAVVTRRTLLAGGTAAGLTSYAALAAPTADADIGAAATDALKAHGCPGLSVAVGRRGKILLARGYGLASVETRSAVTEKTIFRIGSLTKQFTAAAVIKLAAQGRVSLSAPISQYLPAFGKLPAFSVLESMNHTAGLHSDEGAPPEPSASGVRTQIQLADDIAGQVKPFDFAPGTAWLYSNANYIVLGAVIESVTGKPLAQAMADLVVTPLRLETVAIDRSDAALPDRATGYSPGNSPKVSFEKAAFIEIAEAGGAGAMRGNAVDLCRWHQALLGGNLFGQVYLDIMLRPGLLRDGRLSGANRFSPDDAHYGDVQYACGLLVSGPDDPHPNILHYGFINGFSAMLQTYRDSGISFAVLCNSDVNPDLPFRSIRKAVVDRYIANGSHG